MEIVVLHDRGSSPHQGVEKLVRQKLIERRRVLDFSMFRSPANLATDIEDLLPETLYVQAFNSAYEKELKGKALAPTTLGQNPRIVERINAWLNDNNIQLLKDWGFNHYRVAQALLPKLTAERLSAKDLEPFERLFEELNKALGSVLVATA